MNFFEKENARRVAHVVKFNKAHGREATENEMLQMFGFTAKQHTELLRAARTGTPAQI